MLNIFQNNKNRIADELSVINLISSGTSITGNITCTGDIRVDGMLQGNLTTNGKLVTGSGSEVEGDIKILSGKIGGIIKGNIFATGVLEIERTARIEGNISSNGLIIQEGADLRAEIRSRNKNIAPTTTSTQPTEKRTADISRAAVL